MRFIAWLRKVQETLHQCAEAARNAQHGERQKEMPADKPIEIHGVVTLDQKTITDVAAQYHQPNATQESIKRATWAAVVAASVYALISLLVWCAMLKQNRIASENLKQSTESFQIDERAWIELLPVSAGPVAPASDKFPALFSCDLLPTNNGKTVARDVIVKAQTLGSGEESGSNAESMRMIQDKMLLDEFTESGTNNAVVIPKSPIPKVLAPGSISPVPLKLSCPAPQVFPNGHQSLSYMIGRIDYCDQFQIKHWMKFCFYVVNARGEVRACQEGNDEDRNTEEQTPQNSCAKPN
jgi:hypothetical protein